MFIDRDAPLRVQSQTVRPRLAVLSNVHACIAAMRSVDGDAVFFGPAINQIVVGVTEKQVTAVTNPDRPLRKKEPARELLDFGAGRKKFVESRVFANYLRFDLLNAGTCSGFVKVQSSRLHPNEVIRAARNWTIKAEDRDLKFLTRLGVVGKDNLVWRVPSLHHGAAALSKNGRKTSVDPDFSVVINDDFKRNG